jgi:hypothetical protein
MEDSGDPGENMADISGVISIMFQVLRKVRLFIMLILLSFTGPKPIMPVQPSNPPPAFDMVDFLHASASYDLDKVFAFVGAVPPVPRHVPSERPGGEARREILKGRAQNISRSVCETFAYATSRTISAEDTAAVLETFANVR